MSKKIVINFLVVNFVFAANLCWGYNKYSGTRYRNISYQGKISLDKPTLAVGAITKITGTGQATVKVENKRIIKPAKGGYSAVKVTEKITKRKKENGRLAKFINLIEKISSDIVNAPIASLTMATDCRLDTISGNFYGGVHNAGSVLDNIAKGLLY